MSDRILSRPASEAARANWPWPSPRERREIAEASAEMIRAMTPEERRAGLAAAFHEVSRDPADQFWKEYVPNRIAELAAEGKPGYVVVARDFMPKLDQRGGYVDNVDCTAPDSEADYVCPECTDTEECIGRYVQRMDAWPDSDGGETD